LHRSRLHGQLVIVRKLADAGVFDRIVDLFDWRENRVNRNDTNRLADPFVAVGGVVTTTTVEGQFHEKAAFAVQRGNRMIRVHHFDFIVMDDITCRHDTCPAFFRADVDRFRSINMQISPDAFDIEDDFGHVFNDTLDR